MVNRLLPLAVRGAEVRIRGRRLIGPVDLDLTEGGPTIVMGPNGSGKTSLLRLLHGLERPRTGKVRWSAPRDQARAAQSFVLQSPIMMRRSVIDCIAYPLRLRGVARAEARREAGEAATQAGLGEVLDTPAPHISGGEKQKLALARALITEPQVLFLDEPCANLDGRATREIEATLRQAADAGVKIVMSTHNIGQARRLAEDVIFMARGVLIERTRADSFFQNPQTSEAKAFLEGGIVE